MYSVVAMEILQALHRKSSHKTRQRDWGGDSPVVCHCILPLSHFPARGPCVLEGRDEGGGEGERRGRKEEGREEGRREGRRERKKEMKGEERRDEGEMKDGVLPAQHLISIYPGTIIPIIPGPTVPIIPGATVPIIPGATVPIIPGATVPTQSLLSHNMYHTHIQHQQDGTTCTHTPAHIHLPTYTCPHTHAHIHMHTYTLQTLHPTCAYLLWCPMQSQDSIPSRANGKGKER